MKWFRADALKFAVLLVIAIGAGPASSAVWQWSTTASQNATADPSINWSEGMSPSSVNDSARAMMAAIANWRNDLGGLSPLGGTASAYTLTSGQGGFQPNAAHNGFIIGFITNATNAAGATINVDGGGAKPIRMRSGQTLPAGTLVLSSVYHAVYYAGNDEWLLHNPYGSPNEIPIGAVIDYTAPTSPNPNFISPEGQCISRTTYAAYFALVSTFYGTCDGSTTFAVPDLRGRVLAAFDAGAGRIPCPNLTGCGVYQAAISQAQLPVTNLSFTGAVQPVSVTSTVGDVVRLVSGGFIATTTSGGAIGFNAFLAGSTAVQTGINSSGSFQPAGTISQFGSGQAISLMQPTMPVQKLLRIL